MSMTPEPALRTIQGGLHSEDIALRQAFVNGDRAAFDALTRPLLDSLYTLCLRMTKNSAEAEDIAQDSLIKALDRAHRYDPNRPFRPWLLKVAVNLCRDRLRTVWWKRVMGMAVPQTDPAPNPERCADARGRDRLVRHAMASLPPIYREALALYHLSDLPYAEISEITGVAVPALKQRVRRGSTMLREKIATLYPELTPVRTRG
jgi:RNA polymerase sigma-70 factor (ECF subfamily)